MNNKDVLIVGFGPVGVCIAATLLQHGKTFDVCELRQPVGAWHVGTGVINPITGKRSAFSPHFTEAWNIAINLYSFIEANTSLSVFKQLPIVALFNEDSIARAERHSETIGLSVSRIATPPYLISTSLAAQISPAGKVDFGKLIEAGRQLVGQSGTRFIELATLTNTQQQDTTYTNIVDCTGADIVSNPIWEWIPMEPVKGEVITIRTTSLPNNVIIRSEYIIAPLNGNTFTVGSTYDYTATEANVTPAARTLLIASCANTIGNDFTVEHQLSAFRPTVKDRMPVVGFHPTIKHLAIVNGMGSKAALYAPFSAKLFVDGLLGSSIQNDFSVNRFYQ